MGHAGCGYFLEGACGTLVPWSGQGDPECGICLAEYVSGEMVRLLSCRHHFHAKCVDRWLQQYLKHCPFCRAAIEPPKRKED